MAQRLLNWGGKFALEIAPLLGLAGKLAAGATDVEPDVEQRAAVSQQSSLRTEYTTPRQVYPSACVNKHITTIQGETLMMDGGMVRAAAHSGGGTGRTGAVRSASMTSFRRNPQVSRWRVRYRRENRRRISTLRTGSCRIDPQSSCRPCKARRTHASSRRRA